MSGLLYQKSQSEKDLMRSTKCFVDVVFYYFSSQATMGLKEICSWWAGSSWDQIYLSLCILICLMFAEGTRDSSGVPSSLLSLAHCAVAFAFRAFSDHLEQSCVQKKKIKPNCALYADLFSEPPHHLQGRFYPGLLRMDVTSLLM